MSKYNDLWGGIGWFFTWLGLLGGIALIVWAAVQVSDGHAKQLCIQQHGYWKSDTCDFGVKK